MHPPLQREHPDCMQVINELMKCHEENKIGKWFGACNNAKASLDSCFRREKEKMRMANSLKAKADAHAFEQYCLRLDEVTKK